MIHLIRIAPHLPDTSVDALYKMAKDNMVNIDEGAIKKCYMDVFPSIFTENTEVFISPGWHRLVYEMLLKLRHLDDLKIIQIKQKFASLRINYDGVSCEIEPIIEPFKNRATTTCEYCEGIGKGNNLSGWFLIICDDCYEKHKKSAT